MGNASSLLTARPIVNLRRDYRASLRKAGRPGMKSLNPPMFTKYRGLIVAIIRIEAVVLFLPTVRFMP
jgi:hypothetical protein